MAAVRKALAEMLQNPLDADVIIIDEMSMVDIYLMHALLDAVIDRAHGSSW